MKGLSRHALKRLGTTTILNTLPDGAYITDVDRNILFWNNAAERITGWTRSEVIGHSCNDNILVHMDKDGHELCGKEYCPLHRCIVTGKPSHDPLIVYAKHRAGNRIPVEVSVSPIQDDDGIVIGGIELFRDLTENMKDLERAHLIQKATLTMEPCPDPRVTLDVRYTPSEMVGGDFYHYAMLSPDLLGVMLADVMGHGVASALYSMQLRSLWEDWRGEAGNPAEFLTHINHQLRILTGDAGYFATALCLNLNLGSGTVEFVRAGHTAPLHIHPGRPSMAVGESQPALGMFPDVRYTLERLTLSAGESLLLYTDGAIEITNADNEELEESGLITLLSEPESLQNGVPQLAVVEEKLLTYSSSIRLPDDLTLLSITRR